MSKIPNIRLNFVFSPFLISLGCFVIFKAKVATLVKFLKPVFVKFLKPLFVQQTHLAVNY